MAVDYEGNVLASTDYFTSSSQVMVAYVPTRGVPTMYAMIGDLFAWLAAAAMVALIAVAIARKRVATYRTPGTQSGLGVRGIARWWAHVKD